MVDSLLPSSGLLNLRKLLHQIEINPQGISNIGNAERRCLATTKRQRSERFFHAFRATNVLILDGFRAVVLAVNNRGVYAGGDNLVAKKI